MKKIIFTILLTCLVKTTFSQAYTDETLEQKANRMQWYEEARFGMFIHWGAYSVLDGEYKGVKQKGPLGEWIMRNLKIPIDDYKKDVVGNFNPVNFNADEWVKAIHNAGMKYLVITTKHHDGFAMFHSKVSDYNIVEATPFKRNVLGEIAEACKKYNIKLGVYYSQAQDWYHPGGFKPNQQWDDKQKGSYQAYFNTIVKGQVTELLTEYGDIGLIWWDSARAVVNTEVADAVGKELIKLQPEIIVNPRLSKTSKGDFTTYEQVIPAVLDDSYNELCLTHNHSWSYKPSDKDWKSPEFILKTLTHMTSIGGNFLFNVGPKPNGELPEETLKTLDYIGDWMAVNSESIYGTQASPFYKLPFGEASMKTEARKTIIYLFVYDWPANGTLPILGLKNNIDNATLLGAETTLYTDTDTIKTTIKGLPKNAPHDSISVIKLEINEPLNIAAGYVKPNPDNTISLKPSQALFTIKPQFEAIPEVAINNNDEIITHWKKRYDNDRHINTGNKAHWKVQLEQAATYKVVLEYATKVKGNIITLKGKNLITKELPNSGNTNTFKVMEIGQLQLKKGLNTITLTGGKKNDLWDEVAFKAIKLIKL